MKKKLKYFSYIIIFSLILLYFYNIWDIGIIKNRIETDARKAHQIPENWLVAKDTTKSMSALVFYPDDLSRYTLSIYVNRPGLSFGYNFRYGGAGSIEEKSYVQEFRLQGIEDRAFISIDKQYISRVEIDDGTEVKKIDIYSKNPFVIILPINCGHVTFYDLFEKEIEIIKSGF